ncbi:ceramide synthase 1 isoform X1 [Hydra vulgaris]|uniref:ceramide synthase 1 isoform X1 n=1 Tax=Hydra vulgaris TaxID=6087 RepID=UPI001F5FCE1D|nr:ceramide synthase 1 [Hydra vulgaris]
MSSSINYTFAEMGMLSWQQMQKQWSLVGPYEQITDAFLSDVSEANQMVSNDFVAILMFAVLFTLHRYVVTICLLKPIWKYLDLFPKEEKKFYESCCKSFYYAVFFIWEYYLVNIKYPELRYRLASHWEGFYQEMEIPDPIKYLYLIQSGYYIHSIFATVFMDVWKKDSIAMLYHHVLALTLILFSYSVRYHCIGLIVLYLHDPSDVILEATKLGVCINKKKKNHIFEAINNFGFVFFILVWIYFRLYLYPQIVLFSTAYISVNTISHNKFYIPFNAMLILLYALNLWWFNMIMGLAYRIATGKLKELDDTREYDNTCKPQLDSKKNLNNGMKFVKDHLKNGHGTRNRSS